MSGKHYLTAREAAAELRISRATLYSYVSRGMIRSEPTRGSSRARRYYAEDVRRLKERKEQRRNPSAAAQQALHFGAPVLESSITLIENGRLYYRGHDALQLALSRTVEEVAGLIWTGEWAGPWEETTPVAVPEGWRKLVSAQPEMTTVEHFQALLSIVAAADVGAFDLRPEAVRQSGARILNFMTAVAAGIPGVPGNMVQTLQQGWKRGDRESGELLNAALILCADHELNVSSFTARCVASAGATPYQVVIAGLSALQGIRHGGYSSRVAAFLQDVEGPNRARAALAARLRRGESIPGFGHRLYPDGDPRGKLLMELTRERFPDSPALTVAEAVVQAAERLIGEYPTLDFGLATVAQTLELPADAPLTLFALGRTIGWIGQAIEQYGGQMIRPRARYTGTLPGELDDS